MKSPIMLVCAMLAAMSMSVLAAEQPAAGAKGGENAQVQAGKGKHAKLTDEQRAEMVNKRLEQIKAKDEALYKELVALKEKDPEAFKVKMHELAKEQGKAQGEAKGKGKRKHKPE